MSGGEDPSVSPPPEDTEFLSGNGFYLRELREQDLEGRWYAWFNDAEVTRFQDKKIFPNSREKQRAYYQSLLASQNDVVFAIVAAESHQHIGNVGLHHIHWVHRTAEFGIVIGEKGYWGRGIGSQCWAMVSRYGFEVLNLNRISAWILAGHDSSRRAAEKAGFRCEGQARQRYYKNGQFHDALLMGLLRSDLETN